MKNINCTISSLNNFIINGLAVKKLISCVDHIIAVDSCLSGTVGRGGKAVPSSFCYNATGKEGSAAGMVFFY
jgi:hypothetical protein